MKNSVKTLKSNDLKNVKELINSSKELIKKGKVKAVIVPKKGKAVKPKTKSEKLVKAKILATKMTEAEKQKRREELKAIRELNPAFNKVVNKNKKLNEAEFKAELVPNLLECKRQFALQKIKNSDFENELYLNECVKTLNFLLSKKGEQHLDKFSKAVTKRKGNFGTYDTNGLIGKMVKAKMNGEKSFNTTLSKVIEDNKVKAIKKANKIKA
tara:strand:+ start:268 stop:903 length:636 start_codon:yes stop_codon:yes gene_type:complete